MTEEHLCVIDQKRHYDRAQVCEPCRRRLDSILHDIATLWPHIPAAMHPGSNGAGQRVSGSREAPLPLRVDVLDLTMPAREPTPTPQARRWPEDHTGAMSAATVLDQWARDWLSYGAPGRLPEPDVGPLVSWLRVRLEWACDHHPAIDEFAGELRDLLSTLRRTVGGTSPKPQRCDGVPCRRCDLLTLFRLVDGSGDIECGNPACRAIMRADEYATWCRLSAVPAKEAHCPTCGPTTVELHPHQAGVVRCVNCKEHLELREKAAA